MDNNTRMAKWLAVGVVAPFWLARLPVAIGSVIAKGLIAALQQWWDRNPVRKWDEYQRGRFLVQDRDAE